MAQRINLALALAGDPSILIADESTSSLDKENQIAIIEILKDISKERSIAILFISHDINVLKELTSKILVLENGALRKFSFNESHQDGIKHRLAKSVIESSDPWLEIENLKKEFSSSSKMWGFDKSGQKVLDGVNIRVVNGQSLGIFGESGAGKSTLAKLILGLDESSEGKVRINGIDPWNETARGGNRFYKDHQIVFQELTLSMNPLKSVRFHLEEPLLIHGLSAGKTDKVSSVMEMMNLENAILDKLPHQLSVGQRQRVLLARALILEPKVLVLDEALSSLDQKNKSEIIDILKRLKTENETNLIFITHEKEILSELCEKIVELKDGKLN